MQPIRDYLKSHVLLFDGALGTYARTLPDYPPEAVERACLTAPGLVRRIHRAYLDAGCRAVKTNTFAAYPGLAAADETEQKALVAAAVKIAREAAGEDAYVFADLGPAPEEDKAAEAYTALCGLFLAEGVTHFLLETLPSFAGVAEAAAYVKAACPEAYVIASFAVNPDGITRAGAHGPALIQQAEQCPFLDAAGYNCLCGATHMRQLLRALPACSKPLIAMPNAGYPRVSEGRIFYESDPDYFAAQLAGCLESGARMLGGCCGTTPGHLAAAARAAGGAAPGTDAGANAVSSVSAHRQSRILDKLRRGEKPILVELDPPRSAEPDAFLEGAKALRQAGADAITIADCPIGRASMDACLLAAKLHREYGIEVLPHMTCRDRNINATKALLLGLSMEGIGNVLVVTGDPVPREDRDSVKGVFQFNSRVLARLIGSLRESGAVRPFFVCGALNVNARNFAAELDKARQKEENGVAAFLTQPVLSEGAVRNIRLARKALQGYIFGGLFPIVSARNARFLQSEVPGMAVDDRVIAAYEGLDRAQGEDMARRLCRDAARAIRDDVDGYYIMTPFLRVGLVKTILNDLRSEI